MCAIIGFHTAERRPGHGERLRRLWRESGVRGLHAFGAAWLEGGKASWAKAHTLDELKVPEAKTLIGHCRYSTSGDWRDHRNNQPIIRPGLALVFNGIVHMGTKAEMERDTGLALDTDNDGEIIAQWIEKGEPWADRLTAGAASYAGMHLNGFGAFAFRNERRPAWFARADGAVFLASTRDIFERAGIAGAEELPPDTIIGLHELL